MPNVMRQRTVMNMQYTTSSLMVVLTYISLSTLMGVISRVLHMPPIRWVKLCQQPRAGSPLSSSSSGNSSLLAWHQMT